MIITIIINGRPVSRTARHLATLAASLVDAHSSPIFHFWAIFALFLRKKCAFRIFLSNHLHATLLNIK